MGTPKDRIAPSDPRAELPELSRAVRPLEQERLPLAVRLTPIADKLRQLNTTFGLRPYRVFLVHLKWSGGEVGSGQAVEISRRELLPTPLVVDIDGTNEILRSSGLTEEGGVSIKEISPKYAEDDLMGVTPDLQDPNLQRTSLEGVEFFWEVQENRGVNPPPRVRRFVPAAVPALSRDGFQWKITLARQNYDRSRSTKQVMPRSTF